MKQHVPLPVVCLARKTDDYLAGKEIEQTVKKDLRAIETVVWFFREEEA